jgi:hypothetical protein
MGKKWNGKKGCNIEERSFKDERKNERMKE